MNKLTWATLSEINNDFFEVQRAIDDSDQFEVIGIVEGSGNSSWLTSYGLNDKQIIRSGTYYYRLRQVDFNGGYEFSDIVAIDVSLSHKSELIIFPNPAANFAQVQVYVDHKDVATLSMTDMLGKEVMLPTEHSLDQGFNSININTSQIPNGSYLVTMVVGNKYSYRVVTVAH